MLHFLFFDPDRYSDDLESACKRMNKLARIRILATYKHRNIILPRIDFRRERLNRHKKITYRFFYKREHMRPLLRLQ